MLDVLNNHLLLFSGNFQKYDYGEEMNLQRYNSRSPPMYDLSKVTVPVALFSSNNDWLAAPEVITEA